MTESVELRVAVDLISLLDATEVEDGGTGVVLLTVGHGGVSVEVKLVSDVVDSVGTEIVSSRDGSRISRGWANSVAKAANGFGLAPLVLFDHSSSRVMEPNSAIDGQHHNRDESAVQRHDISPSPENSDDEPLLNRFEEVRVLSATTASHLTLATGLS